MTRPATCWSITRPRGDVADGEAVNVLIELSRGMEQLAADICRAAAPRCDACPLDSLLPEGGPREADG